jgi:ATP-dependent Clp protease ATP-binding subunit ClpX
MLLRHKVFDAHETNYLLSKVEPEDLISFGMIPEFVGRFNSIANCNELTIEDLVEILTQPKNAIVKQYKQLFAEENIVLHFSPMLFAEWPKRLNRPAPVLERSG